MSFIALAEQQRLTALTAFENLARQQGFKAIAGVDEAGRGPLAGPVVAAACIVPEGVLLPGVDDSKQLTARQRAVLFRELTADKRLCYAVGIVDSQTIDEVNILQATILAMLQAVSALSIQPDYLLVDGLKLPHPSIPGEKIIGGDGRSQSIAAASIIAKETRDRLMLDYHSQWPHYGFDRHKGYGTAAHMLALKEHGPCAIHRTSFAPIKSL
jgi:ribonuclease HII